MEFNIVMKIENADVMKQKCARLAELFAEAGEILGGINSGTYMECVAVEPDEKEAERAFKPGEVFEYHGRKWVALDEVPGGVFCIAYEDFEAEGAEEFQFSKEVSPDWRTSYVRRLLNDLYLHRIADPDDLIKQTIDLTADDGTHEFGTCDDYISLLSCEQYRKYRHLLTGFTWEWLITPKSASASTVCYVGNNGNLYTNGPTSNNSARPALILKSEIFKKCRGES